MTGQHATVSDTFPDSGRSGTAASWCLVCGWTDSQRWSGPNPVYEPNALLLTQAMATGHERFAVPLDT
jgi:hypothetical protein